MTIREVVNKILTVYPDFGPDYHGCDNFKSGDPDAECTGIVVSMDATVNVVRKAIELGANLIVVHEPTYYTSFDGPTWGQSFKNDVYEEKSAMLNDNGIVVWRNHDHMHAQKPDGIFTGVLKYLGWEPYHTVDTSMGAYAHFVVELPEATTLAAIMKQVTETIGMNGARYIGDPDIIVKKLAIVGHLMAGGPSREKNADGSPKEYSVQVIRYFEEENVDLIIPGETVDWTSMSYARDAAQLKKNAGVLLLGHFNWEELGMRYTADWLPDVIGKELKVTYVPTEDMYNFYVTK